MKLHILEMFIEELREREQSMVEAEKGGFNIFKTSFICSIVAHLLWGGSENPTYYVYANFTYNKI